MSSIDEKLAKEFLDDTDNVDLSEATGITDGAAKILSKHEGYIGLTGLTELSDAAAKSLSKHKNHLNLNSLTELSDAAAESFSKHEGDLSLDGLTELSDAAVESLSNIRMIFPLMAWRHSPMLLRSPYPPLPSCVN